MGVDGIGSGGGRPVRDVGGAAPTEARAVEPGAAGESRAASSASPSAELARLERGEIDLDRYLDSRVDDAVRHLEGKLAPAQIHFVKESLRAELASDPVLMELVRRTTGAVPRPSE